MTHHDQDAGASSVHVVLPNDIDDPATPSGGNVYDRRICHHLAAEGWRVREHAVPGAWPHPGVTERIEVARVLASLPDGATTLIDGLIASTVPDVLGPQAQRLRLTVLMHMPLGDQSPRHRGEEREALAGAAAIVATSQWTRRRLLDLYALPPDLVHVAPPGADPAPPAPATPAGSRLLCVAAVTPGKGHDLLLQALATIHDTRWSCLCVGSLDRDPGFADRMLWLVQACGIDARISFAGPRTGAELDARFAAADLLVLASRGETYGMVVTEALARGIPALTTSAGGLPEALGRAPDGSLPGLLVPPGDPEALAGALRRWLTDPRLRRRLRTSARQRRTTLNGWDHTAKLLGAALSPAHQKVTISR